MIIMAESPNILVSNAHHYGASLAQMVKHLPAMRETRVPSQSWEDSLEKGQATHSSILA